MPTHATELADFLGGQCTDDVRTVVLSLAGAAMKLSDLISRGRLAGDMAAAVTGEGGGDPQKYLDVHADGILQEALADTPVSWFASEENPEPIEINPGAPLALAVDPLDGSSNIDTNSAIGTIFSLREAAAGAHSFLGTGLGQLAAGFVIYGPQTALVFTVGEGTHIATLDRTSMRFMISARNIKVANTCSEYAINGSNARYWPRWTRDYVQDCQAGSDGPAGVDFNTRWIASLVADAYRILVRGGIYLYPADTRKGYENGRLRLVYEAFPIAMLVEQAGGAAIDGHHRILDKVPSHIHARTPLIFGSNGEVSRLATYLEGRETLPAKAPLFAERGLFRA